MKRIISSSLGCNIPLVYTSMVVYADDIILMEPLVRALLSVKGNIFRRICTSMFRER